MPAPGGSPGRHRAATQAPLPARSAARRAGAHARRARAEGGFLRVFGLTEFRALWSAQLLSVAGDQMARVALTVLVYDQTRSALLAAVAYAGSIAPVFL